MSVVKGPSIAVFQIDDSRYFLHAYKASKSAFDPKFYAKSSLIIRSSPYNCTPSARQWFEKLFLSNSTLAVQNNRPDDADQEYDPFPENQI